MNDDCGRSILSGWRAMAAIEALANAVIGLVVSWSITFAVLGYGPTQSAAITAMFFGASFARAWVLRIIFRRLERGNY